MEKVFLVLLFIMLVPFLIIFAIGGIALLLFAWKIIAIILVVVFVLVMLIKMDKDPNKPNFK